MIKNYIYIFIVFLFTSSNLSAQESKKGQEFDIEIFSLYPNPVTDGKLYITSAENKVKEIEIFDILGRVVLQTLLIQKELSVSHISPGVYIIKIKEAKTTVTRKLIIK